MKTIISNFLVSTKTIIMIYETRSWLKTNVGTKSTRIPILLSPEYPRSPNEQNMVKLLSYRGLLRYCVLLHSVYSYRSWSRFKSTCINFLYRIFSEDSFLIYRLPFTSFFFMQIPGSEKKMSGLIRESHQLHNSRVITTQTSSSAIFATKRKERGKS